MKQLFLLCWFGAFLKGELVGDLGIYRDGTSGRFQSVETHPHFRRQGICGTLVYESAKFALEKMGLTDLVMIADENYHAAKIYELVGFVPSTKNIRRSGGIRRGSLNEV